MFKLHRYDEIDEIRKQIDEERRGAEETASRKLEEDYVCAKQTLYERQKTEMDVLDASYLTKKNEFTSTRDEKDEMFNKLVKNLEQKRETSKDQDKVWNLYHRHDLLPKVPEAPQTARTSLAESALETDTTRVRARPLSQKVTKQPVSARV